MKNHEDIRSNPLYRKLERIKNMDVCNGEFGTQEFQIYCEATRLQNKLFNPKFPYSDEYRKFLRMIDGDLIGHLRKELEKDILA